MPAGPAATSPRPPGSRRRPAARWCPLLRDPLGGVRGDPDLRDGVAVPFGFADGLHGQLALLLAHPVDEQDAVQVVGLVLHAAGEQLGALDRDRLTMHVEALSDDP